MSHYRITEIFEQDGWCVVQVDMLHADGSFWHRENFRWRGGQGLCQKRQTNPAGEILMDDGLPAPTRAIRPTVPGDADTEQYLPSGRQWARRHTPHMEEDSILGVIESIYKQRLLSGWPQGQTDILSRIPMDRIQQRDLDGCPALVTHFAHLKGCEVNDD